MASQPRRDRFNSQSLGVPLNKSVKEAKILMVGAGGIGCELLKNLVLSGFGEIHIVDLDTIDLSNLNRQFLFRHEHIKKSKALVAKEAAHRFNPKCKLEAHHANIKEPQFNVDWFREFTIVFNALDNVEARRHVNKMCLSANVPLIESGTTGFNGQVQVIKKGLTACYDCTPKETPKSFPVCTIRSTPSQPIHCIVWGKSYLLAEIFGASEEESADMVQQDGENAEEIKKLKQEAEALKQIREAMGTESFPQLIFDKVYKDDIVRLRSMEEMWRSRRPPEPMDYASVIAKAVNEEARKQKILKNGQEKWTLEENVIVFKDSLERLSKRMAEMKASATTDSAKPQIAFDKDDEDTLDFVTASANLRSLLFGIETKSRFEIKQMAGNIIPAIATTNAIVAGLCVLESFKVLQGDYSGTKEVFLSPFAPERLLASDRLRVPNPDCPVCSVAETRILVDMSRATLHDLVEDFLKLELGYGEEITVNHGDNLLYDVDETENLARKLTELGITSNSFLTVMDDDGDNPRVNLILSVKAGTDPEEKPIKSLDIKLQSEQGEPVSPVRRKPRVVPETKPTARDSSPVVIDDEGNGQNGSTNGAGTKHPRDESPSDANGSGPKRKIERDPDDEDGKTPAKKPKRTKNDSIIIVDDDGTIAID